MIVTNYIMDAAGNIVPEPNLTAWGEWLCRANRTVARTNIGESLISTVFLGIDHSFGCGAPLLFETIIFGGPLDGEQCKYCTKEQAIAGHEDMVKKVREILLGPEWVAQYNAELERRS